MPESDSRQRIDALSVGALLLVVASLGVVVATPGAAGYEASIYDVYPVYFWLSLVGAILVGSAVIVAGGLATDGRWRAGFVAVFLAEAILLFLPTIRGYATYGRADSLTHIGFMRSIRETGRFGGGNIYPALHDLGVTITYATGLPLDAIVNLVPPVISLFSLLSVLVLVHEVFDGPRALFVLPFGLLLVLGTGHLNFAPYVMSTLFVPFVLYLYFKYRNSGNRRVFAVLVAVLVSVVIYHPLTTLFLFLTFAIAHPLERSTSRRSVSFNIAAVLAIVFGIWYFGFVGILRVISTTVYNLAYSGGESDLEQYSEVVAQTSPRLLDLVQVALFEQGIFAVASVFAGLCLLYLAWRYSRTGTLPSLEEVFFPATYVGFGALSTLFLLVDVVGGFDRPLAYAKFYGVLASGLFFGLVATRTDRPVVGVRVKGILTVALVTMVVISAFGLYPSPIVREQNRQTTQMDLGGTEWVFEHADLEREFLTIGVNPQRYYERAFGTRGSGPSVDGDRPPDHFGYATNSTFGERYPAGSQRYLLITEYGRSTYPQVFPDYESFWRFTRDDFRRLERDPTVLHVYDNGEFDGYDVEGTNETAAS